MEQFTDQQIIDEMLKRFIVPQWFSREHVVEICEDNGLTKPSTIDKLIQSVKYNMYQNIDQLVVDEIEYFKEEEEEEEEE